MLPEGVVMILTVYADGHSEWVSVLTAAEEAAALREVADLIEE